MNSKLKYALPFVFLFIYLVPLFYLFNTQELGITLLSKFAGVIAFINIFAQIMLGAFRNFFKKSYNPLKVFWFHNYLGLFTLLLVIFHIFTKSFIWSNFWNIFLINSSLAINLGVIAFYLMSLTVISSDLKYFFKINYDYKLWRFIHLANYLLFPIIYFHIFYLGTIFDNGFIHFMMNTLLAIASAAVIYRASISIRAIKRVNK
jgi:predicted ferric reductase